jgi:D-alanyl-D-alanine carboxypeptidase
MKTIRLILVSVMLLSTSCKSSSGDRSNQGDNSLEREIQEKFEKQAGKKHNINESIFLVHSDSRDLHLKLSCSPERGSSTPVDKPFHVASIGKTFTSVLVAMLVEEGVLSYDDPINRYLDPETLDGLFVVDGVDYSADVQIRHLLNHTSGAADFYEDKPHGGPPMIELMALEPDRLWTIPEVLQWTRNNLDALYPPGEGFHYSDTGYELMGLIIDRVSGMTYEQAVHERILDPLGMKHSYVMFYSEPAEASPWPMCDLYYGGVNLAKTNSSSFGRAGGAIVSTTEDLLKFIRAIKENRLISGAGFEKMQDWQKFGPGIDYGYGLMRFRFLGAPAKYMIWGNSGSIGSYMYYNEKLDTYFIGTFNHVRYERQPIMFLARIIRTIFRSLS